MGGRIVGKNHQQPRLCDLSLDLDFSEKAAVHRWFIL